MTDQILYGVTVVPAIVGLVQVAKEMGIPSHLAPGLAIVFGLLAGTAEVFGANWPVTQAVVVGVALGLSASGLYSGAGAVISQLTQPDRPNTTTRLQDVAPAVAHGTEPIELQPAPAAKPSDEDPSLPRAAALREPGPSDAARQP